jgi:hypothetical protein
VHECSKDLGLSFGVSLIHGAIIFLFLNIVRYGLITVGDDGMPQNNMPSDHHQREVDRQQRHAQQHDEDRKPLAQARNWEPPRQSGACQQPWHATGEQ